MAMKIRLTRMGSKKRPFYRIVALDSATRRDGRALEYIGHYNPMVEPAEIVVDAARLDYWAKQGATCSDSVRTLLKKVQK
ncbi:MULTISPECIES: 30S ribosomal protein S16 [Desulfovibrio]|jgi:small subunit ribosomal protein S16|uniref:30S ribosomal protein S16 n=1 Tax=Desulfovibrio TaxID=872 RepID=UPI00041AC287|nr:MULTISPECIES: 30S ribosomal protein S16 [Desulfovibrio]MDY0305299.1 30S ribosomal protein S16 [Desulfovibrionaceae bacterium]HMM37566.1 30S ribosomal protein S16 [Desulfovibrio sp.]